LLRASGHLRKLVKKPPDGRALTEYDLMRHDNAAANDLYRAGEFWAEINADFQNLIWAGALKSLRNEYFNRRFSGPDPCSLQVYRSLLHIYNQKLLQIDRPFVSRISDPAAGGIGDQAVIDGRSVSLDLLQSVEEALTIRAGLDAVERPAAPLIIVELGAGYGRLAHVCRRLWPDCTYVILDLPEALICAQTWLGEVFPGDVVPYSESRSGTLDRANLLTRRIWCLGAQDIERLPSKAVDVFINVYSFAEMPAKSVANYYSHLQRITRGLFYTKQRKVENNLVDKTTISEETYPALSGSRELMRRTATLYDEMFEALYAIGG
jgi:putative sugar O-methyltransferase